MNKKTDYSRLLDLAGKGDQEAFTEIYEATSQAIYRTVHAMVRDEELTLDIQQETYIQAFTHLDQLSSPDKLLPWLRAIAVNQTRTVLRKRQPILFSELSGEEDAAEPEFPDESVESSPELSLDRKQTAELVRELLEELTDAQRMLVGMYYYEQIPVRQIAADLGVSEGAVKTQLRRSRKKIESGVQKLEQKGVKLYGAAPMPFLLALLSRLEPAAEESKKVLAGALTRSGAAKASVLHVGRRFTETAAGKVLLGLLAAGVIGGGIAGYSLLRDRQGPSGDVRPTDTTFAVVMEHHDSQEDLPTVPVTTEVDPSEPVAGSGFDTPEDLPTQPTEPQPANPKPTDPQPANPQPTAPQPTNPQPTEPQPTATEQDGEHNADSRVVSCWWAGFENHDSPDLTNVPPDYETFFYVVTENGGTPEIIPDDPSLLSLIYQGAADQGNGRQRHEWAAALHGSGVTTVTCSMNGAVFRRIKVESPYYPVKLIDAFCTAVQMPEGLSQSAIPAEEYPNYYKPEHCLVGTSFSWSATIQCSSEPEFELTTDRPDLIRIVFLGRNGGSWYKRNYDWRVAILGSGSAKVYLSLNGTAEKVWTVDAIELTPETEQP